LREELLPAEEGFEQALDGRLRLERLSEAIERLTAEQHQVIVLRFAAGLKLQEVAYAMNKSVAAVKMLQLRALARLREWVAQSGLGEM
jgi:RNA polymerase sigma-70 factor (ECF subfamily)